MKLEELKLIGIEAYSNEEGWKHCINMERSRVTGRPVPTETTDFFARFARAVVDEGKRLQAIDASRKERRSCLTKVVMDRLQIVKHAHGRKSLSELTQAELKETKQWSYAVRVAEELNNDLGLTPTKAYENVAGEYDVDEATIRRAYVKLRRVADPLGRMLRRNACIEVEASELAQEIMRRLATIEKIPKKPFDLKFPIGQLKVTFCYPNTASGTSLEIADVLSSCLSIDGEQRSSDEWDELNTRDLLNIGDQIIKRLGR